MAAWQVPPRSVCALAPHPAPVRACAAARLLSCYPCALESCASAALGSPPCAAARSWTKQPHDDTALNLDHAQSHGRAAGIRSCSPGRLHPALLHRGRAAAPLIIPGPPCCCRVHCFPAAGQSAEDILRCRIAIKCEARGVRAWTVASVAVYQVLRSLMMMMSCQSPSCCWRSRTSCSGHPSTERRGTDLIA